MESHIKGQDYIIISILEIGEQELDISKVEIWQNHTARKMQNQNLNVMRSNHCYEVVSRIFYIVCVLTFFRRGEIIGVGTNGFILVPVAK